MADKTLIPWCDATWPVVQGCDPVSPGCANCYVPKELWRMMHNPNASISTPLQGTADRRDGKTRFTGKVVLREDRLTWPMAWKVPRKIFLPSHGDIFHKAVPDSFLDRIFAVAALCPQHTLQVLTKRPERMLGYFRTPGRLNAINGAKWSMLGTLRGSKIIHGGQWMSPALPLPNVWLGISVERQEEADERIPLLLRTLAAVRWISREPGLTPTNLNYVFDHGNEHVIDALVGREYHDPRDGEGEEIAHIDWVVDGGESGSGAREFDIDASRDLERQCVDAGVAYFRKQLGAKPFEREPSAWPSGAPHGDGSLTLMPDGFGRYHVQGLKSSKGGDPAEWPADLRRREFPLTTGATS